MGDGALQATVCKRCPDALLQVIGFIYTAVVVVIRGSQIAADRGDFSDVKLFNWSFDALFAIPIVVFGFNCHANVVTIFG